MNSIIKTSEKLWQECISLSRKKVVFDSELYDDSSRHFVLAYGPVAQRNQFQSLLYSAQHKFNVSILPIHNLSLLGAIPWLGQVVCHFHWIHDATKNAKTESEADEAVIQWESLLRSIKSNGHKIMWTVHNIMPHESLWPEHDKKIRQSMADAADALHCMARETPNLTASCYFLDETKMFLLPHPTYEGCQPDEISRAQARTLLNIDEKEFVFLSFGAIMEYKGYERLTAAYDLLVKMGKRNTRLVIAGFPSDKLLVQKLMVWGADRPDVILKLELVPNNDIQIYFRSADTAVFPYRRTLNSGAAMMAITFDLPVLGPNTGCFLDIETMGCGTTFDKDSEISLFAKMYKAIDQQVCTKIVLADAKKLCSPFTVSSSFFESINKLF